MSENNQHIPGQGDVPPDIESKNRYVAPEPPSKPKRNKAPMIVGITVAVLYATVMGVAFWWRFGRGTNEPIETTEKTDIEIEMTIKEETAAEVTEEMTTKEPFAEEAPIVEETTVAETDGEETTHDIQIFDPEKYVVISTAEDLMSFNKAVNEDGEYFDDMTVVFLDDIDMSGHVWTPLNGNYLYNVTFEGYGHTICNLQFADHSSEPGTPVYEIGSGFVDIARDNLTFLNLTIDTAQVTAYERAIGCFVGVQIGGFVTFENCTVRNFTVDGWMDYYNQDSANSGHPVSFRQGGFVGHNMSGTLDFANCHVENIKLSGFHNMAGFVGYGTELDEFCFENCSVKNLECTFSYCMADSYSVDDPRKFVSVFFNQAQWINKVNACVELGNTYENVRYYDWSDNNTEYNPSNFVSWSEEEAGRQ